MIIVFLILELLLVNWGTPSPGRMFAYFMDEWHGVQAIRALVTRGTINVDGAALGTPGYYALAAAYLGPFVAAKTVDPWTIKNPTVALSEQQKLWWILRGSTWLWAIVGIFLLRKLTGSTAAWLVIFSPLWLAYSSVFKYDVPVAVGILLFAWRVLVYTQNPSAKNWYLAALTTGLVATLKFSLLPLFPWLAISCRKGLLIPIAIFLVLGLPDLWIPGHLEFWRTWLTMVFAEGGHQAPLLIWTKIYPELFGLPLYLSGLIGLFFLKKDRPFWLAGFVLFVASLLTIGIGGVAGRATVLLPFLAIGSASLLSKINSKLIVSFLVFGQLVIGLGWWKTQTGIDTRLAASNWIQANIPAGSAIGVPNIPIYQKLPDVLVNDFYGPQYQSDYPAVYQIKVGEPAEYVVNPVNYHAYRQIALFSSPQSGYDPIGGLFWQPTIQIFQKIK